jgi:hypothetical protein
MDIKNENEIKKENNHSGHQKGKAGKVKKIEGKKPGPVAVTLDKTADLRGRAKSNLVNPFDNKKPLNSKKDSKPVITIGNDRFNMLKSMFEKKAPANNEEPVKKFEPKKFSVFQQNNVALKEEKKVDPIPSRPSGISDAIKKRMEDLMNSSKKQSAQAKIDPILEQRKVMREFDNNDDEDEKSEDNENLGISEEEDNLDKDDGLSESEEEKEEFIEEKDDDAFDDSFDDKKEKVEIKDEVIPVEAKQEEKIEIQQKLEEEKYETEDKLNEEH